MTTLLEVRWNKVQKKVAQCPDTGCHIWTGSTGSHGYGTIQVKKITHLVHRVSYVLANGRIHEGDHVHHTCHNKTCVNPAHLQCLSPKDHGDIHHKKIDIPEPLECKHGHKGKYKKNTQGHWICHQCQKERDGSKEYKEKRRLHYHKNKGLFDKFDFIDIDQNKPPHRPNHTSKAVERP